MVSMLILHTNYVARGFKLLFIWNSQCDSKVHNGLVFTNYSISSPHIVDFNLVVGSSVNGFP